MKSVSIRIAPVVVLAVLLALTGCAPVRSSPIRVPAAMSTSRFWKVIEHARGTTDPTARSASPAAVREQLDKLSDRDVAAFAVRYDDVMEQLNQWNVWDAGYAAAQGMGDDDFDYFRAWLIGKGQVVVSQALSDPDGLVRYLTPADESKDGFDNEDLDYVTDEVLVKTHPQSAVDAFDEKTASAIDNDPPGKETDEKTIDARFPLLAAWGKKHDH
jgi:hypothetical protein